MAERMGFEEPALHVAPRTKSQAHRLVLGLRRPEDGGEGGIQARVIGRRLWSTVVWKPA